MALPASILVEFGGQREEHTRSTESAISALGWALVLIYMILAIQFNSLTQPLIVLATIPLAQPAPCGIERVGIEIDGLERTPPHGLQEQIAGDALQIRRGTRRAAILERLSQHR